ncbi:verrucotoxin subunit beta-like isoform X2 [Erpetoichthys calabaricus]|uniref:verrucotoxin subunit beta-like isoform X2 n=1 Tax=Erpetoichthys calabaricus TaxID=27687 RepID=UPI00223434DA|nr:verrucotoxin subunit beta-like isoform X2 [Erpetoichthys calabaricus]
MAEQLVSITTAALGRPFQLGMLYDCRSDQLVPGVTLWSKSDLEKDISVKSQRLTEYSLETSNSLTDKSKALEINASLRGSFACGLVKVEGSAKYLYNTSSSKNQARVTLNYFMTTVFKQLTMSQLSRNNVTYEEVFRQGTATHVVTAILYGARALMVFDRDVSKDESTHTIAGELKASIEKIPKLVIHGKGSLDLSAKEKEEAEKIRCTFHGDFYIRELPVDYLTSLDVYKKLPTFLGEDGEHAVPVTVWLYPLSLLDSSAARLMYEISTDLVTQAERVLDSLLEAMVMCDYLLTDPTVKIFYNIEKKISKFKTLIERYKLYFQKMLAQILPSVRGGTTNATALGDILEAHRTSPFSQHKLEGWLCSLQTEIGVIEALINGMEDSNVSLLTGRFDSIEPLIFNPNIKYIVNFNLNLLSNESKSLNTMENYFISEEQNSIRITDMENNDEWVHSQADCDKIRLRRQLFLDFASNNQQNEAIKFVVTSRPVEMQESSSVLLYCKGELRSSDFEPPSTPAIPKVLKTSSQSAEIELSLPPHGSNETIKYLVQFRKHTEREWRSQMTRETEKCFTLEGLQRSTQYDVRYAAVCEAGMGPPSEIISVKTGEPESASCCCEHLEKLDLSYNYITEDYIKILALTIHIYRRVSLSRCGLTSRCCSALSSALSSPYSRLTELNLSENNNMEDSGVDQLCEGLRSENCKLEKLTLPSCGLTSRCCSALSSALSAPQSRLTKLNLSRNIMEDSGVDQLCDGVRRENCKLEKLNLSHCRFTSRCCSALSSALSAPHSRLTELDLSGNNMEDSGVDQLCEGLRSENCKLEKLNLLNCDLTSRCCSALSSALSAPHSRLTELNLSINNYMEDSGVDQLREGLRSENCKLEKLNLSECGLTSRCCSALSSALSAPHTRLTELDLSYNNNMEDTGVDQLCEGLRSENCKLEKLDLSECGLTSRCCSALSSALSSPHSQLTELNLSDNNMEDSGVDQLCEGLRSENCKLEKLNLSQCHLTSRCCSALSSALSAPHSQLTEISLGDMDDLLMVMNNNNIGDSGVDQLCEGLRSENCKLEKLNLNSCCLTSRCCSSLSSVLSSPHSQLTELKLSRNKLGYSGAHQLCEGLRTPNCKLKTLRLSGNEMSKSEMKNLRSLQEKLNRTGRQVDIKI